MRLFKSVKLPSSIGDKSFVDWVKQSFFKGKVDHNIPIKRRLLVDKHLGADLRQIINMITRGQTET